MTRWLTPGYAAAFALMGILLAGCTGRSPLADQFRSLTSSRDSLPSAFAACKTWLTNGGPASAEFQLVGAQKSTLANAKVIGDEAGSNTASDPNFSNYPGSSPVAVCALTGPMAKEALRGNMLIYYVVMNSPSNGLLANYDDPNFKKQ